MSNLALLKKNGYVVLRQVLSKGDCANYTNLLNDLHQRLASKYAHPASTSSIAGKPKEKVVYNLHNKGIGWYDLFDHPEVISLVAPLLQEGSYQNSEPYYLNNISARTPLKGNLGQQIHIDSNLPGVNYALSMNVMWFFEDSTAENGATIVVPNTVSKMEYAPDGVVPDEAIKIEAKAGDVLIFHPNLWHGGGPNLDGASRWALVLGYARWFIKPSYDYMFNTPEAVFNELSISRKKLLGFDLMPPKDEFSRLGRRSEKPETPYFNYMINPTN